MAKKTKPKMVLWTAAWCGPCQMLKPWVKENHPDVEIKNMDFATREERPKDLRSVPALEIKDKLLVGVRAIREELSKW